MAAYYLAGKPKRIDFKAGFSEWGDLGSSKIVRDFSGVQCSSEMSKEAVSGASWRAARGDPGERHPNEALVKAGAIEGLFDLFDGHLQECG